MRRGNKGGAHYFSTNHIFMGLAVNKLKWKQPSNVFRNSSQCSFYWAPKLA
ncbi:hypothetical protein Hanom_Chr15g01388171 [Helianthus anomalus]